MQSAFHNPEELESERISQEEAAQVVKLWAEKQRSSPASPGTTSVRDLAEGLDIPAEKARELLREVRESKAVPMQELPSPAASRSAGNIFVAVGAASLGIALISLTIGVPSLTFMATLMLIGALVATRRWGFAGAVLLLVLGLGVFYFRGHVNAPAATRIVIEAPPPPAEAPTPPPPPSIR